MEPQPRSWISAPCSAHSGISTGLCFLSLELAFMAAQAGLCKVQSSGLGNINQAGQVTSHCVRPWEISTIPCCARTAGIRAAGDPHCPLATMEMCSQSLPQAAPTQLTGPSFVFNTNYHRIIKAGKASEFNCSPSTATAEPHPPVPQPHSF